jgi:catechol 2,3-dioxygenase-like lactoylglutathione lyase family enzyme
VAQTAATVVKVGYFIWGLLVVGNGAFCPCTTQHPAPVATAPGKAAANLPSKRWRFVTHPAGSSAAGLQVSRLRAMTVAPEGFAYHQSDSMPAVYRGAKEKTMFSHVMLGVNNLEASKTFYDALLGTLGIPPGVANRQRYFYRSPSGTFAITTPINGEGATHGNGSTIGFNVQSPEQADAFHAAGIANGGTTCEEPPGFRNGSVGKLYLAYLRDPDGNKLCALHRPAK